MSDLNEQQDLAACPYCGGPADTDFIEGESYLIECSICGSHTGFEDSPADAIAAWNRRAPAAAPALDMRECYQCGQPAHMHPDDPKRGKNRGDCPAKRQAGIAAAPAPVAASEELIPTWEEAEARFDAGTGDYSALDFFIYSNEPAGDTDETLFRTQLQAAITEVRRAALAAAPAPAAAPIVQPDDRLDGVLRDMLAIQEVCGLHTDEYAPGSVIEYIKELEADAAPIVQPVADERALFKKWLSKQDHRSNSEYDWEVWQARAKIAAPTFSTADAKDAATWRGILEALMRELPKRGHDARNGNAPGHCHDKPGIWDGDNGVLAGKECAWCKVWNEARAAIASSAGEVKGGA